MSDALHDQERELATNLVGRARQGERHAEAEIVARYSRGLRFLLRRKTRNAEMAEDFLQETWVVALAKIRATGLDDPGRLAGYLCGIANNLVLSDQRRLNRQRTTADTEIIDLIPDESSSPFSQLSRAEVCRHVQRLLKELHQERDREILQRFYVQEEDKSNICRDLKVDSDHFNRVLFRARQRFKDLVVRDDLRSRLKVVG